VAEQINCIKRDEIFSLHEHYESVITEQLSFCFRYLNFYIALLSAMIAATITGLLKVEGGELLGLTLLIGPILVIFLAKVGYKTIEVFYRRFIEAWITVLNIEEMLGLKGAINLEKGLNEPLFKSQTDGGFISQFERPVIQKILENAKEKSLSSEEVLEEVVKVGDTLQYAKKTFIAFGFSGVIFFLVIIFYVLINTPAVI
jgi:hypothetical protein